MKQGLLLQGVRVADVTANRDETTDLFISAGGRIEPVPASSARVRRVDAGGLLACPGLWDVHVHFRDPGKGDAETLLSGALAAAAGGFTHVVTMPNTDPACDTPEAVRLQAETVLPVRVLPAACVTQGRAGKSLADLAALAQAGAVAFTDDGAMVADPELMAAALSRAKALGLVVMDHAVLPHAAGNGMVRESPAQRRFDWPVFPAEAETGAVAQDIALARKTGAHIHLQHLSCGESLRLIEAAMAEGVRVTSEITPHHLCLSADDIPGDNGDWKMNPPLGTPADTAAIRDAVLRGTATCFATDHAPHSTASKSHGFAAAPFGVIGLETAAPATWTEMVQGHGMRVLDWVRMWTQGAAGVLGKTCASLAEGETADLAVFDIRTPRRVDPAAFRSMSANCPFAGREFTGHAVLTICEGRVTFDAL